MYCTIGTFAAVVKHCGCVLHHVALSHAKVVRQAGFIAVYLGGMFTFSETFADHIRQVLQKFEEVNLDPVSKKCHFILGLKRISNFIIPNELTNDSFRTLLRNRC